MSSPLTTADWNSLWAQLLVEELSRLGVRHAFLSPGSRNTPLLLAAADHPRLETIVHFDERGAAFAALGLAKAAGTPVAIICTSGTAAVNYYPAVVEAAMDQVPLVVITADRPPELRQLGANQTIDQVKLYAGYVRFQFDLPCPGPDFPPARLLAVIDQAVAEARTWPGGPVHLNCMFREPFVADPIPALDSLDLPHWRHSGQPQARLDVAAPRLDDSAVQQLQARLQQARNGLIILGAERDPDAIAAARRLCGQLRWPVIADVQSGLHGVPDRLIRHHDLLLRQPHFQEVLTPDVVLLLGGRLTSKHLLKWLARTAADILQLGRAPLSSLPTLQVQRWVGSVADLGRLPELPEAAHLADSQRWSMSAADMVQEVLDQFPALTDAGVARTLARLQPPQQLLFAANSLPVRQLENYAATAAPVMVNRGASGIDGNIAAAAGAAIGTGRPVTALIGDLAALHDLNSLALWPSCPAPSTLVVSNNNGGGIFHFLPGITDSASFERCFAAAHGRSFAGAAAMFDLPHRRVASAEDFADAFRESGGGNAHMLIEAAIDRRENCRLQELVLSRLNRLS